MTEFVDVGPRQPATVASGTPDATVRDPPTSLVDFGQPGYHRAGAQLALRSVKGTVNFEHDERCLEDDSSSVLPHEWSFALSLPAVLLALHQVANSSPVNDQGVEERRDRCASGLCTVRYHCAKTRDRVRLVSINFRQARLIDHYFDKLLKRLTAKMTDRRECGLRVGCP